MPDEKPAVPEVPEHVKLEEATRLEKQSRAKRVMTHIEEYCKANNCLFIAIPQLEPSPNGGFVIKAAPGVNPL